MPQDDTIQNQLKETEKIRKDFKSAYEHQMMFVWNSYGQERTD